MKMKLCAVILSALLCCALRAGATVLPDACGDDSVKFDVSTQKQGTELAAPETGMAQIVFVETIDRRGEMGGTTTRFGMDGKWVGANQGNSYFGLAVAPGEHHLCANWQATGRKKNVGMATFTAEAGKVYFYEAKIVMKYQRVAYGSGIGGGLREESFDLAQLSNDEGKYRVKLSALSTWKPNK